MAIHRSWWWALVNGVDRLSWLFVNPGNGRRGCYWVWSFSSILEVGPHGQSSMGVVGAHCVSWQLWEERGSDVWYCVHHLTPLGCVEHCCLYFLLGTVLRMGLIWECAAVCILLQLISTFDSKIWQGLQGVQPWEEIIFVGESQISALPRWKNPRSLG